MAVAKESIPRTFVSLQDSGYRCDNYYARGGGEEIGISKEFLESLGLIGETLWVHRSVLPKLKKAKADIESQGFGILIKDAWRPIALYDAIIRLRKEKGFPVEGVINGEAKPHSTGMAIDVILINPETKKVIWTRNQDRDGLDSCYINFYQIGITPEQAEYHRLQVILMKAFIHAGFELGSKKEYWHFQLPEHQHATKY